MKSFTLGIMATGIAAALPGARADQVIPVGDSRIAIEGRVAAAPGGGLRMGFPGVTLHLRLKASRAFLETEPHDWSSFDIEADGLPPRCCVVHAGATSIDLLAGVPLAAEHTIVVTRRNESWQGTVDIKALVMDDAGQLLASTLPARRFMFIGDSITCGSGVLMSTGNTQDKLRSNARLTYGKLLSGRFGAQCALVSYGGRGVTRTWDGLTNTNNAPQFYGLALPDDPAVQWNASAYIPDLVVIGLGTNDFNLGIPDEQTFVGTYVQLVKRIMGDAPGAAILLVDSPILEDSERAGPRKTVCSWYLDKVVSLVASPRVTHVALPHYKGTPGDGHPSAADHAEMAALLAPHVAKALGVETP
jgi:lysophospholipase L1-like esterase